MTYRCSLEELIQAGAAANIPPQYIEQAVQEIRLNQVQMERREQQLRDTFVGAEMAIALLSVWNLNQFQPQALISRIATPWQHDAMRQ